MKAAARLIACLMLPMACAPVSAQETGTLIKHKAAQMNDRRSPTAAREVMEDFAACMVSRSPGRTLKIVSMQVDTKEYDTQLHALFDSYDECMEGGQATFNTILLRGALFQAFYAREFRTPGPVTFDPALDTGYRQLYGANPSPEAIQSIGLEHFGECVSRADGADVRALLRASTGSPAEAEAFTALAPKFSACLTQGQKFTFSKAMIKGVLAEGMYRLSVAARDKVAVK